MRYLCTRFGEVLWLFQAGRKERAGEKKKLKIFSKRLPETKRCLPLQPGSAEPVREIGEREIYDFEQHLCSRPFRGRTPYRSSLTHWHQEEKKFRNRLTVLD
jgi:hypothetical protein